MRKHRKLLAFTVFAVLAITIAVLLAHDPEPRYNGRSLSTWLRVYGRNSTGPALPKSELPEANQALHAIGTNALPFVLKWIQQEPPYWQRAAHTKLPEFLSGNAPTKFLIDGPGYEKANEAIAAFVILGTNAAPAIPDLVALTKGTNLATVVRALVALSHLGTPAFPHLAAALTNTNQQGRAYVAPCLLVMARDVGTNVCLAPLKTALQDPDPAVRASVSNMLRYLAPDLFTNAPAK